MGSILLNYLAVDHFCYFRKMAPRAGFEPATCRLTVECSTAELPGNARRLSWRERGNTNALTICQALFSKKMHSPCFIH